MAVTLTSVALPRFDSAMPLEPATAQDHTSSGASIALPVSLSPPILLLLPLLLFLLRGRPLGAAGRVQLWTRSHG